MRACIKISELFSKMWIQFIWNENATQLSKDEWCQLQRGVPFSACVSCDDDVTCEVQTLEEMMDDKFMSHVPEEEEDDDGGGGGHGNCGCDEKNACPATF